MVLYGNYIVSETPIKCKRYSTEGDILSISCLCYTSFCVTRSKMLMDIDTQTLSNMHFYKLMGDLNRFDFHHGKPWQ